MRTQAALFAIAALLLNSALQSAEFPAKPVTMVVPFAAGGPTDTVARLIAVPMTFLARKGFPAKDLKELIGYVKANKAKVTLANAGLGAASHLCGLLFQTAIGTDLNTIAYKGTAPAITDLLGGHVDLLCDQTTNTTAQIQAGKVQVYGMTAKKRVPSLPNVPTTHEAGLPGFDGDVEVR